MKLNLSIHRLPLRWPRLRISWNTILGGALLLIPVALVLAAPWITNGDPTALDAESSLLGPSWEHPFGTDLLGRDQFTRVLYGGQMTLRVAVLVLLITVGVGMLVGSIAGYVGGLVDDAMTMLLNIVLALPELSLTLALVAVLGPGENSLLLALVASAWAGYARLFRGAVRTVRYEGYVEAARALGASHTRMLLRHVLPNVIRPLIALATVRFATIMLALAGLSYLGLGAQPPAADWGTLLNEARPFLRSHPHLVYGPALFLGAVSLGANLLADGLLTRRS
jgi:peptide/nickel transport system permease protein